MRYQKMTVPEQAQALELAQEQGRVWELGLVAVEVGVAALGASPRPIGQLTMLQTGWSRSQQNGTWRP